MTISQYRLNPLTNKLQRNIETPIKFTSKALVITPEPGLLEYYEGKFYISNGARKVIDRSDDVLLSTVTVSNTTVETTVATGLVGLNSLNVGNILEFIAAGTISSSSAADVCTLRVYIGTTLVTTLISPGKVLSLDEWHSDEIFVIRTIGSSGTLVYHGHFDIEATTSVSHGSASINTTASSNITITAQWNNAKSGNILNTEIFFLKFKN